MLKYLLLILILFLLPARLFHLFGQTTISGTVTDRKGEALPGASIAVKGSYEGATTDTLGKFLFKTRKKDTVTIAASYLGYETELRKMVLNGTPVVVDFRLKEEFNDLNAVTITAGHFEASDSKRMVMMRPMDIVTTASGNADITSVMQLLPGSNRVGEQEGLYVRGGSAAETKTVVDGMIVQNPFFSSTPDVPQRGRFSPFQFKGMAFSTGGYSAQYGQALSSVLLLDSQDKLSDESSTNVIAHLAGVGGGYTHKGKLSAFGWYTNIKPFLALIKTNIDFVQPPQGWGSSLTYNDKLGKDGTLKMYATFTDNWSKLGLPDYTEPGKKYEFALRNRNFYSNNTYKKHYKNGKWNWLNGLSFSQNNDALTLGSIPSDRSDQRLQGRSVLKRLWGKNMQHSALAGIEMHRIYTDNRFDSLYIDLTDRYSAVFAETEFYVTTRLALRAGVRGEHTSAIDRYNWAPRLSLAYKTGDFSQVSLATGRFWQTPDKNYLYLNHNLDYERADHFILNFQRIKNERTFRMEVFDKEYDNLVLEHQATFDPNPYRFPAGATDNSGYGYARGFDVFFRDKKSIPLGDFWVTYSFLDTRRKFLNYPTAATPVFASKHNFSAVYKQFIPKITSNIGITYSFASGRPYYDAQNPDFLSDRTKPYHNISLAASHVRAVRGSFVVFFASLDNVLGTKNEFGYRYSPDGLTRYPVIPVAYRTAFFGVTANISRHAKVPDEAKL